MTSRQEPVGTPLEGGAVSSMFAVLGFAIFVSLALVVDGGRQLGALSDARDIADNAARVGSQEVDLDQWRVTGRPVVDQGATTTEIADFMNQHVIAGRVDSWRVVPTPGPDADISVSVEVTITPTQFFLPVRPAVATESAVALDSVTGP